MNIKQGVKITIKNLHRRGRKLRRRRQAMHKRREEALVAGK